MFCIEEGDADEGVGVPVMELSIFLKPRLDRERESDPFDVELKPLEEEVEEWVDVEVREARLGRRRSRDGRLATIRSFHAASSAAAAAAVLLAVVEDLRIFRPIPFDELSAFFERSMTLSGVSMSLLLLLLVVMPNRPESLVLSVVDLLVVVGAYGSTPRSFAALPG